MSDDLGAFWSARLDDVEFRAREGLPWQTGSRYEGQPAAWVAYLRTAGSPEFALAQVAADRGILKMYDAMPRWDSVPDGVEAAVVKADMAAREALEDVIRTRAAVYAGHPDYREAWKP